MYEKEKKFADPSASMIDPCFSACAAKGESSLTRLTYICACVCVRKRGCDD